MKLFIVNATYLEYTKKTLNLIFITNHLAPNIMIGSTIASGVILNQNILHECIALMSP